MRIISRSTASIAALAGIVTAASAHSAARQQALDIPDAERIEVPAGGASIPTKDVGGRPTVDALINGQGPYALIVDTGASITVLDPSLIADLKLPRALTNVIPADQPGPVRLEELRVGQATLHGVTAGRVGLLGGLSANPPRGVLSAAAFPGSLVTLDYPHAILRLETGGLPAADNRHVFQYEADEILPVIPVTVAGRTYRVHLDSGAPGGLMLPTKDEDLIPLTSAPVITGRARTAAGEFPVSTGAFAGPAAIGDLALNLTAITFSDLRPGAAPGIGTVGGQILKDFVVTLDAANRRIRLERPKP